jgi:hypothetical protein
MDIFLSHASEDKDAFVRPLAERLRQLGVSVWYDEFEIKPGESIRASVDRGLRDARFGVVVLSEAFFSKGWTRWELAGLVQRHLNSDRAMLIPIWHGLGAKRVAEFSPPLADMMAVKSSMGIESVARQIAALVLPPLVPLSVPAEWRAATGPIVRRRTADNVLRRKCQNSDYIDH